MLPSSEHRQLGNTEVSLTLKCNALWGRCAGVCFRLRIVGPKTTSFNDDYIFLQYILCISEYAICLILIFQLIFIILFLAMTCN